MLPFALLLTLLTWLVPPTLAAGSPTGTLSGSVANHSTGGGPVSGMTVTLQVYQNQTLQRQVQTATDQQGHFQFSGLDEDAAYQYLPVADYQGVTYAGQPVRFPEKDSPVNSDDIAIYDATTDDPGLRYLNATLVLGSISQATQHVSFLELLTLENPSDRTFVPAAPAQGMPKNLLRFGLPSGVDDIGVQSGLDLNRLIEVDRGLASTEPLSPGDHTISFSFSVPYQHGAFAFAWPLLYPASQVHLLAPVGGPQLSAPGLTPDADLNLDGHTFRVLSRGAAGADAVVDLTLSGLPNRTIFQTASATLGTQGSIAVAGLVAAGLAALLPFWYLRRRRSRRAPADLVTAESLLDALAALDDAHERGDLEETSYQQQRAALKEGLRRLPAAETLDPAQPG